MLLLTGNRGETSEVKTHRKAEGRKGARSLEGFEKVAEGASTRGSLAFT